MGRGQKNASTICGTKVRTIVPSVYDHPKQVIEFVLGEFFKAILPIIGGIILGCLFGIALVVFI